MQEKVDEIEAIERYLILLLGVVDRPIPSKEHLQKELFILSRANPRISEILKFDRHYKGPYSQEIDELIKSPSYYGGAFSVDKKGLCCLTEKGKKIYENLVRSHCEDERFKALLAAMKMVRELYDKLSVDELLFLIYVSYPEYRERSIFFEKLLSRKKELAESLLRKGLITKKKFEELLSYENSPGQYV